MKGSTKDEMIARLSVDRNGLHQEIERLKRRLRLAGATIEKLRQCYDQQRGLAAVAFEGWQTADAERQILEAENERLRLVADFQDAKREMEGDHESC